ncbi:MAG: hypothetical protein ABSH51_23090 [Solirubrobacteraceae bacterium]
MSDGSTPAPTATTAAASVPRPAGTTFAGAGCALPQAAISQSMSGRVSGCLRVGALAPGSHTVVVVEAPGASTAARAAASAAAAQAVEPAVSLTLSPASGGPGAAVTVRGRLSAGLRGRSSYPDFCWDGCRDGLSYAGVHVTWTSARTFTGRLVVPAAPWIEGAPLRVVPLVSGTYAIGVRCLVLATGCAGAAAEGTAGFALEVPAVPMWCLAASDCARLAVAPAEAEPGDVVKVTGDVPLVSVIGSDRPFVTRFAVLPGRSSGPQVDLGASSGRAPLDVQTPPSFAALGDTRPIAQLAGGLSAIAANPADPSIVAWCAGAGIGVSGAPRATTIPTTAVPAALAQLGFAATSGSPIPCTAVAPIAAPAGGPVALAAAFSTSLPAGGPPFYDVALFTIDGGRTWAPLPVPSGASAGGFGGFRFAHGGVEALFAATAPPLRTALAGAGRSPYPVLDTATPLAELSTDGGRRWHAVPPACPARGPCVTLGPYMPGDCAGNAVTQPALLSADGGATWSQPGLPDLVDTCAATELVATAARTELLVNSASAYPLVRSTDGGRTWNDVGLPPPAARLSTGAAGIVVLADGSLLRSGGPSGWELLRDGARAWCRVRTPGAATQRRPQVTPLTVIGADLWWLSGGPGSVPAPERVALAGVSC